MPIFWQEDVLCRFFESVPERSNVEEQKDLVSFLDYKGKNLLYSIYFHLKDELVMISGDLYHPFGADSLFEIAIPCDSISECPDGYYPGNTGLAFWYGDPNQKHNMTMMLLKRPDGDLKVWPSCVWPERHAYNIMLSTEFAGKRYDPAQ